jgi:RimJ/RimL family protein N-acetyltransferase
MIIGSRTRLRGIERDDITRCTIWMNDPEVIENLQMRMPISFAGEEKWFERNLTKPLEEQVLAIEAKTPSGWTHIGNCGFHFVNWINRSAEMGIAIGEKSYWNQGHGTDAVRLLLRLGFNELNLNRISLEVYSFNTRAIRCYEKSGFVLEGRLRQAICHHGEYVDALMMSVLRSEWRDTEI